VIRLYAALGLVAIVGIGLAWGGNALWKAGYAACQAERAAAYEQAVRDAAKAADLAARKEVERLAAEASRAALAQELEDLANAGPVGADCLSVDRVQRLNRR
jgi:membrane protein involved in colicin uptake